MERLFEAGCLIEKRYRAGSMERRNCLNIKLLTKCGAHVLLLGSFTIMFGATIAVLRVFSFSLGALIYNLSALSQILGALTQILGALTKILGALTQILGAFIIMIGPHVTLFGAYCTLLGANSDVCGGVILSFTGLDFYLPECFRVVGVVVM